MSSSSSQQQQKQGGEDESSIASEVLAASLGGAISAAILYPLEVLKTKMQASEGDNSNDDNDNTDNDKINRNNMIDFARRLYQRHGLQVFVTGIETSALQSATEKALYFFAYTGLKHFYYLRNNNNRNSNGNIPTMINLLLGYMAEWAHLPLTVPLDCWTTAIQTRDYVTSTTTTTTGNTLNNNHNNKKNENAMLLLCNLISEKGIRGMYKGIQAYIVLCLKPAIQYTVFEQGKHYILFLRRSRIRHSNNTNQTNTTTTNSNNSNNTTTLTAMESFCLGMVARTVATILVFPYLRAKVVMQTTNTTEQQQQEEQQDDDDDDEPCLFPTTTTTTSSTTNRKNNNNNNSVWLLLCQMYKDRGLEGCFQGLGPELTRGIFSAALMLMIKEQLVSFVHRTLYGPRRQRRRMLAPIPTTTTTTTEQQQGVLK